MKLKENHQPTEVAFATLSPGTVFKSKSFNGYVMKTETINDCDGFTVNAVLLEDGTMVCFGNDEIVRIVDCELIIN